MLVNHILLDLWNGERRHYLHMPFPFHNTVLIKTWHQLSLLPLDLMFIVGNTHAKMPQKAGSCSGQEVFKSSYFGPLPQRGEIQLRLLGNITNTWIWALSFMCHWEPICLLERVGCLLRGEENQGKYFPKPASISRGCSCGFSSFLSS